MRFNSPAVFKISSRFSITHGPEMKTNGLLFPMEIFFKVITEKIGNFLYELAILDTEKMYKDR